MAKWSLFNLFSALVTLLATWTSFEEKVQFVHPYLKIFIVFALSISIVTELIKYKRKMAILSLVIIFPSFFVMFFILIIILFKLPLAP